MQAALFAFDASHQRANLVGHEMVDLDRDPAAAGLIHESRSLFDRLRPVHLRSLGSGRSPGDIDGRSGRTQLHGYPSSRSSGRSGDQGNFSLKPVTHHSPRSRSFRPRIDAQLLAELRQKPISKQPFHGDFFIKKLYSARNITRLHELVNYPTWEIAIAVDFGFPQRLSYVNRTSLQNWRMPWRNRFRSGR